MASQLDKMSSDDLLKELRKADGAYDAARENKRRIGAAYDAALAREREQASAEAEAVQDGRNGQARTNVVRVKNR